MRKSAPILTQISKFSFLGLCFLFPVFFLPTTVNFFETNKFFLLIILGSIAFLSWLIKIISEGNFRFTSSPFTPSVALLGFVTLLSAFFSQSNRAEAFMGRGLLIPLLTLLFIVFVSVIRSRKFISYALYTFIASSTLVSFITIFQALDGLVSKVFNGLFGTNLPNTLAFSPAGSPLAALTFVLPIMVGTLILAVSKKDGLEKLILFLLSGVMLGGVVITTVTSLPGKDNSLLTLSYRDSYVIMLETFKGNFKTALLGWGPEGYVNAYTQTRPVSTNYTPYWNLRFANAGNELFTVATTTGLLGAVAWLLLLVTLIRNFNISTQSETLRVIKVITSLLFVMQLFLPANMVLLVTSYLFLTLWTIELKVNRDHRIRDVSLGLLEVSTLKPEEELNLNHERSKTSRRVTYIITLPLILVTLTLLYLTSKAYAGEIYFKRSVDAASKNDAQGTIENQRKAILANPYVSNYHRSFAQTNFAIANSLSQKKDLSEEEKGTISALISQSIASGKAAIQLDPLKTANWENLAVIYRDLINVAEKADEFTTAAYSQAILTDPHNPVLRLDLGGVFFNLKRYDEAIRLFIQSAERKEDWANAYYNLSAAYKAKNELQPAAENIQITLSLTDPASADYQKAKSELEALKKELGEKQAPQTDKKSVGELQSPKPLSTPVPNTPITLPEEAAPEIVPPRDETTPTSKPAASAASAPTPKP